jgi:hypothetical protein
VRAIRAIDMNQSIEKIPDAPFSDRWWDSFLKCSSSLTQPAVMPAALAPARVRRYEEHVLETLRCLGRLRTQHYGFRVYIEGRQLPSSEMDWMYDRAPQVGESLQDWVERAFEGRKFGIIYNTGEKFVPELSDDVATMLQPLFAKIGHPREGVQFSVFIGNYDSTPLGIHQDKRGENVMHLHIGPGNKTMHLWDADRYRRLLDDNGWTRRDLEQLRPHAKRFDFSAGDVFFMPEGTYHIGSQEGLSIGITVWQYTHTDAKVVSDLHQRLFRQILPVEDKIVIRADASSPEDTSGLDELVSRYRLRPELEALSYAELLRETYRDWRHCVHSNAGYRNSPFPREELGDLDLDADVQLVRPYRILARVAEGGAKLHVYVRGSRLELNYFDCLPPLFDALNDGRRRPVRELLALLDSRWDPAIGLYVLREIHRRRGLHVLQPAASTTPAPICETATAVNC